MTIEECDKLNTIKSDLEEVNRKIQSGLFRRKKGIVCPEYAEEYTRLVLEITIKSIKEIITNKRKG